jgi:hypothetical protein
MSDANAPDERRDGQTRHVTGGWLFLLGLYVVAMAAVCMATIVRTIPACDATGLVVNGFEPARVLTTGKETLRISGEGFARDAKVSFGGQAETTPTFVSQFELLVTTPALPAGHVAVTVTQDGTRRASGLVLYAPPGLVVKRVVPTEALLKGDEWLRIFGERFSGNETVAFGGASPLRAQKISDSELLVRTVARKDAGVVDVVVADGTAAATLPGSLRFVAERTPAPPPAAPLLVSAIQPASSPAGGGEAVTITGTGFTGATLVRFGGLPARAVRVHSDRFITAVTPIHPVGAVSVIVGNESASSSVDGRFAFVCPAVPDRTLVMLILFAGALGGLVHALRSFFWYAGHQELLWNWVPMYLLLPFSSAALGFVFFLVVRAGIYEPQPGTAYLLVGLAALVGMFSAQATEKLKAIAEGIFTKAPAGKDTAAPAGTGTRAPAITSLRPATGPEAGRNVVTISGTGFTRESVVRFGQVTALETTFVNATAVKAVAPAKSATDVVDVAVQVGTKEAIKERAYTYVVPKGTITGVTPGTDTPTGGATVTISGTQFGASPAVSFGDRPATSVTVTSPTTLEATAPAQAAGKVDVRVDDGTVLVALAPEAFEYTP